MPLWVKVACAVAIALGTYLGGWRIIRTLGKGLVDITPPQGMAAQSASAAVILASSHLGFALSTTHVATGSIVGSGVGRPGALVRWAVAGRMVAAWMITLPAAGVVGALMWWIGHLIGGLGRRADHLRPPAGRVLGVMCLRSRRAPVDQHNVNDDWEPAPEATASRRIRRAERSHDMHNLGFALDSAWKVLVTCLVLGAGLPALFALGIRSLAYGAGGEPTAQDSGVSEPTRRPIGTVAGYLCFAIVLLGVVLGITFIVASGFGKALSFEHVYPTIVSKH